jgi:hypothetical protein
MQDILAARGRVSRTSTRGEVRSLIPSLIQLRPLGFTWPTLGRATAGRRRRRPTVNTDPQTWKSCWVIRRDDQSRSRLRLVQFGEGQLLCSTDPAVSCAR